MGAEAGRPSAGRGPAQLETPPQSAAGLRTGGRAEPLLARGGSARRMRWLADEAYPEAEVVRAGHR